jgi:hypothetical protein
MTQVHDTNPQVHHFDSTGDAYDACNADDNVKIGDVVVVKSESVVGFADAWPFALTEKHGHLHTVAPKFSPEEHLHIQLQEYSITFDKGWGQDEVNRRVAAAVKLAKAEIATMVPSG